MINSTLFYCLFLLNHVAPPSLYNSIFHYYSLIHSDEGLTLETSVFESFTVVFTQLFLWQTYLFFFDGWSLEPTRKRRQSNSPSGTCPPNDEFPPNCPLDRIQRRCLMQGRVCTYFRNCGLVERDGKIVTDCRTIHLYDDFICCTSYCLEE